MTQRTAVPTRIFTAGISNGEFGLPERLLPVMARGEGCRLWDEAGSEYIDFSMGWGSVLVGHARPEVVAAVARQVPMGSNFAYLNSQVLAFLRFSAIILCCSR